MSIRLPSKTSSARDLDIGRGINGPGTHWDAIRPENLVSHVQIAGKSYGGGVSLSAFNASR